MDFKNVVYTAARDGKLRRLKVRIARTHHIPPTEIFMYVVQNTLGAFCICVSLVLIYLVAIMFLRVC